MQIWVDADACPGVIKEILFRAAERAQISMTLVANQLLRTPPSRYIKAVQVPAGFDVADGKIVQHLEPGDLVITADIPLADRVVTRGAFALDPRGKLYTQENIKNSLAMRGLFKELRDGGMMSGGPAAFGKLDRQTFANRLDSFLTRHLKVENGKT